MSSEQFERKIRERLSSVNMPPRPELWDRIEAGMAENNNNRKGGFWWLFSDGLGIILLLFLFFFPLSPSAPIQSEVEQAASSMSSAAPATPFAGTEVPPTQTLVGTNPIEPKKTIAPKNGSNTEMKPSNPSSQTPPLDIPTQPLHVDDHNTKPLVASARFISRSNERAEKEGASMSQDLYVKSLVNLPQDDEAELLVEDMTSAHVIMPSSKQEDTKALTFDLKRLPPKPNELLLAEWDHALTSFPTPFPKKKRFSWLVYFTPEYSFSQLSLNRNKAFLDYDYSRVLDDRNAFSTVDVVGISFPRWQYTGGFGLEYALTDHWHVQTGIGISASEKGTYGVATSSLDFYGIPGANNLAEESLTLQGLSTFRTTQLEIPLMFNYHLKKGRDTWILSAGGAFNFTFNDTASRNKSIQYTADNQVLNSQENSAAFDRVVINSINSPDNEPLLGLPDFNSYVVGRILYQRSLSPSLSIYTGPSVKYQISKVFSGNAASDQLPFRIGWEVGIKLSR